MWLTHSLTHFSSADHTHFELRAYRTLSIPFASKLQPFHLSGSLLWRWSVGEMNMHVGRTLTQFRRKGEKIISNSFCQLRKHQEALLSGACVHIPPPPSPIYFHKAHLFSTLDIQRLTETSVLHFCLVSKNAAQPLQMVSATLDRVDNSSGETSTKQGRENSFPLRAEVDKESSWSEIGWELNVNWTAVKEKRRQIAAEAE